MEFYEMETLMDNLYLINQEQWEMTRNLAYFILQPQTKKQLKPEKLMNFPWDSEKQKIYNHKPGRISEEEDKMLKAEAKYLEEKIFGIREDK